MVAYLAKPFTKGWNFGGHEIFHSFVLAGHISIVFVDLLL
jgi:hypothetical protein